MTITGGHWTKFVARTGGFVGKIITYLCHSLPGSGRHSQKIYIFWKLFTYRIIIAIHNSASWVLPNSDFFQITLQ